MAGADWPERKYSILLISAFLALLQVFLAQIFDLEEKELSREFFPFFPSRIIQLLLFGGDIWIHLKINEAIFR